MLLKPLSVGKDPILAEAAAVSIADIEDGGRRHADRVADEMPEEAVTSAPLVDASPHRRGSAWKADPTAVQAGGSSMRRL